MKLLIVSKCPTHPCNAGNRRFILSQVELLKQLNHEVHFLFILENPIWNKYSEDSDFLQEMIEYWKDRLHVFRVDKINKIRINILTKIIRPFFNNGRIKVDDPFPKGVISYVNKLNKAHNFDCCIVNYYYLSKLLSKTNIPLKAITTHDYFCYKDILVGEKNVYMGTDAHQEAIAMQRSPHIFALNTEEAILFSKMSPKSKIYNVFSIYEYIPSPIVNNHNILFLSGPNQYNINGLQWFIREIFPSIISQFPDVKLVIGGSICKAITQYSQHPNIDMVGYVDNQTDFYANGDVVINPTYQGTGLKIKTFESIGYDKVTLVHPHSMTGIYRPNEAPLFYSLEVCEWVNYLKYIWSHTDNISLVKKRNKEYIEEMRSFIKKEYIRFFNNKDSYDNQK